MNRYPINLFVEEAAVDAFDPEGDQLYQIVAHVPDDDTTWVLTGRHTTTELAMDELRRQIRMGATRYELDFALGDIKQTAERAASNTDRVLTWAYNTAEKVKRAPSVPDATGGVLMAGGFSFGESSLVRPPDRGPGR